MIRHGDGNRNLLFLFLVFFAAAAALSEARCLSSHRDALLRLRSGLYNETYSSSKNSSLRTWTKATDCCSWKGVACDGASGEVTTLDLSELYLSGEVDPDALSSLTSLTSLNLAFNNLNFTAASSLKWEKLERLTVLNLSYSGFSGQIPSGISGLVHLESLDFSTMLPLRSPNLGDLVTKMKNLEELFLDGVDMSGNGGAWCSALSLFVPHLRKLSLVRCNIAGPMDTSIGKLRNLTVLRLNRNNLTSSVPGFLHNLSPSLEVLELSSCNLTGPLPEEIFTLRNLTSLDMSGNPQLGGNISESVGTMRSLERLQLYGCRLSGMIPASVGTLPNLIKLDLSNNNLTGNMPPFDSTSISEIILKSNNLVGPIPYSYGSLRKLTVLDVQNNSITGGVPLSLFSLPSLKILDLQQNRLSGSLQNLSTASAPLEVIDFSGNYLQGPLPSAIFGPPSLKVMIFANNNFSGEVELNLLQRLLNLSFLDLSYNRLTVVNNAQGPSSVFPMIKTLKLASCNINQFPIFLRGQTKVNHLDLSANRISGYIPRWLWSSSSSLIHLNLSHNLLTGYENPLPDRFNCSIKIIDIHSNKMQGPIPLPPALSSIIDYSNNFFSSEIPQNISLYLNFTIFLSVSNNSLHGIIPSSLCQAPFLQVLDFSINNFTGSVPECLANISSLRVLNLKGNMLSDSILLNFSSNCSLRTLNLNSNQLRGEIPKSLSNCKMLEVLDLGKNLLEGGFPYWLGNLNELRVLVLRSNRFVGEVRTGNSLGGLFEKLQIFDLSSNNFSGILLPNNIMNLKAMRLLDARAPQQAVQFKYLEGLYYQDTVMITNKGLEMTLLKILTVYTSIDISNNKISGIIPEQIGMLTSLKILNMSKNYLSGPIPDGIGNLTQLESLDLSWNTLSGEIPNGFINLNFLSFLNLSYNNLSGRIPVSRHLDTFTDASYLGNPLLCGQPLEKTCSSSGASPGASHVNWLFVFSGLGIGLGLALAIGPLLIYKKWRLLSNDHMDYVLLAVFPSCFWEWFSCATSRVVEEEGTEKELDFVHSKREHSFCIFCTGLELCSGEALIYHRECSCTRNY